MGRPKGSPNKATREFKECLRKIFENPEYVKKLEKRILDGVESAHTVTHLLSMVYGKPKETVAHEGIPTLADMLQMALTMKKDSE